MSAPLESRPPPPTLGDVAQLMGKISESREKPGAEKLYLCTNKGGTLTVATKAQIERFQLTRLPVAKISQIAHDVVMNAPETDLMRQAHTLTISKALATLSKERQEKYDNAWNVAGRIVLLCASIPLIFAGGVGIFLLKDLHEASQQGEIINQNKANIAGRLSTVLSTGISPKQIYVKDLAPEGVNLIHAMQKDIRETIPAIVTQEELTLHEGTFNAQPFIHRFSQPAAPLSNPHAKYLNNLTPIESVKWSPPLHALNSPKTHDLLLGDLYQKYSLRMIPVSGRKAISMDVPTYDPIQMHIVRDPKGEITSIKFKISGTINMKATSDEGQVTVTTPIVAASVTGSFSFDASGKLIVKMDEPKYQLLNP